MRNPESAFNSQGRQKIVIIQRERGYRWLRLFGAMAILIVLAGCGNGKCGIPGVGHAQQGIASDLRIDDYGPHETKVGQSFNRQPDGSSAAWFRLNERLEGSVVNVRLNNLVIKGDTSGPLVTVRVPEGLYASAGHIAVSIDKVNGASVTTSNSVNIVVNKP